VRAAGAARAGMRGRHFAVRAGAHHGSRIVVAFRETRQIEPPADAGISNSATRPPARLPQTHHHAFVEPTHQPPAWLPASDPIAPSKGMESRESSTAARLILRRRTRRSTSHLGVLRRAHALSPWLLQLLQAALVRPRPASVSLPAESFRQSLGAIPHRCSYDARPPCAFGHMSNHSRAGGLIPH
jgi:hypothetical protein